MQRPIPATTFFHDLAQRHGLELDAQQLGEVVRLAYLSEDPFERRTVDLELHSDGSVSAQSIKAYNLLLFSQSRFQVSILKIGAGAAGVLTGQVVPAMLGLLVLMAEFMEKTAKEFKEQDAKVLLAIYRLGSMCHVNTIGSEYKRAFGETIVDEAMQASLQLLAKYRTVRLNGSGEVEIIETVNLSRQ